MGIKAWAEHFAIQATLELIKHYLPQITGSIVTAAGWLTAPDNAPWWFYLGFAIAGILICLLWLNLRKQRDEAKSIKDMEGIEFFSTREELDEKYPLSGTFKEGNEIHAHFLSGEGVFSPHNDRMKLVRSLILPSVDAEYLTALQTLYASGANPYVHIASQIKTTTGIAKRQEKEHGREIVKWFDSFTGYSFLFCNPQRDDGWVHITTTVPLLKAKWQPTYRLERKKQKELFDNLFLAFGELWKQCNVPPKSKYESA